MYVFFDKIYLKIDKAYKENFKSDIPEFYSISYLMVMSALHILAILKILTFFNIEVDIKQFSKIQKLGAVVALYLLIGIRYYFFFDPVRFEKKHGFSENYMPLIMYTGLFLISFFILILVF